MAPMTTTPKARSGRRPGRPRLRPLSVERSEPPRKKLRYVPGGPGGGGRYIDDDGNETPVGGGGGGGSGGGGSAMGSYSTSTRTRSLRHVNDKTQSPTASYSRPRRDRAPPRPRYSSAAAAATAMTQQSEGYKPREERSWEEFHQDLDIDADFAVYGAEEVDGNAARLSGAGNASTPNRGPHPLANGTTAAALGEALHLLSQQAAQSNGLVNGTPVITPPVKRRVGRPPRRPEYLLNGLGSPPAPRIIPAPTHNPKERLNLPKPNFRKVDPFSAYEHAKSVGINFVDKSLSNVGYQESDIFLRPEKTYIRGGESSVEEDPDPNSLNATDGDVAPTAAAIGRVEYDMDEQDDRWLEAINLGRKKEQVEGIRPAIFEITMTLIEKEWHALEKRIPKPNPKPPQTHRPRSSSAAAVNGEPGLGEEQDTKCAVCDDGDCENTNAIVFCDGCDLAVHQECYGVPFIPEGQWLCRKCQLIGRNTPTCIFCPNIDGAFKQTNTLRWSHLLCAIWIPEVSLGNQTFMEPVMDVDKVPKQRWKLTCYICQQKMGACVQCSNKNCFVAFHVTCARRCRLFLKMKSPHGGINDQSCLKAFCDRHVPSDWRRDHDVDRATVEAKIHYRRTMRGRRWADSQRAALAMPGPHQPGYADGNEDGDFQDDPLSPANKKKRLQLQKKIWRLPSGAPVVPQAVFHNVENALVRFSIRKRKDFVAEACKYWTLKREARRGASLLKRLQLQLETFTSMEMTRRNFLGMGAAGGPKLQRRIEFAERLENDVKQIRLMCERVKEREQLKLRDVDILREIVDVVYFPISPLLWPVMERLQVLDSNYKSYFKAGLDYMQRKLEERYYVSVPAFAVDLGKVFHNVIFSDKPEEGGDETAKLDIKPSHGTLTQEQKDKKMRAKRIIKILQPLLFDASRKEAEISNGSVDEVQRRVIKTLENSLRPTPESMHFSELAQGDPESEEDGEHERSSPDGQGSGMNGEGRRTESSAIAGLLKDDVDMIDVVEHRTHARSSQSNSRSSAESDSAATKLRVNSREIDSTSNPNGLDANGRPTSSVPALSNSGSTNHSTSTHEPLTPPRLEKDGDASLTHGGVPWYLEQFEPVGTTIHDERWTGRDVMRGMSEELSELDDDALDGLVDEELQGGAVNEGLASRNALTVASADAQRRRKGAKRKRLR